MIRRRAIATLAPKGGVGKTHTAKTLYDLLQRHGRRVTAWDLDASTGTFAVYDDAIKTFDLNGSHDTHSIDDCDAAIRRYQRDTSSRIESVEYSETTASTRWSPRCVLLGVS